MPTLSSVNGASLVPDLGGSLNLLLKTFGTKQQRDAEQAKQQQIGGLIDQIAGGGGVAAGSPPLDVPGINPAQTFPLADAPASGGLENAQLPAFTPSRQSETALIRLAQLDPKAANAIRPILESRNERAIQAARADADKGARQAAEVKRGKTFQEKRAILNQIAQREIPNGAPPDRFIELLNMSEPQLDNALSGMLIKAQDIKTVTADALNPKGIEPPKTRELKQGSEIITQQFNPETGRFEEIGRSPRFNPRAGVTVNVGGGGAGISDRPLTQAEVDRFNIPPEEASGLVVDAKGRIKVRPSTDQSIADAEIERAEGRREAGAAQGEDLAAGFETSFDESEAVGGVVPPGIQREKLNQDRRALVSWVAKNILGTPGAEPSPKLFDQAEELVPDFSGPFDRATFDGKMEKLRELMRAGRQGSPKASKKVDASKPLEDMTDEELAALAKKMTQ